MAEYDQSAAARSKPMICPVLLCGGSGTRLWPVSRRACPKQFAPLIGKESLFVASARRLVDMALGPPLVVTGDAYRFLVRDQLDEAGVSPEAVLIEPEAKNTAPAILAAAVHAARRDPSALLLVSPSDHLIHDVERFAMAVFAGAAAAEAGHIVAFGIEATRPETGYGYLQLDGPVREGVPVPLRGFVEKPDRATAEAMLADGGHLWNAGIFLLRADSLIAAFEAHAPDMLEPVRASVDKARPDLGFVRLDEQAFAEVRAESIDYAIMEKAEGLMAVPYGGHWSDLGDWDAVLREAADEMASGGVVSEGDALAIDCAGSYLRSDDEDVAVVGIGLADTLVVATGDAVLVADKSRAQEVKQAVDRLKARGARQVQAFPRDHRPWGWYEVLAVSDRFQVKRIVVKPGAALSLQSHVHRSEHWIVVSGTARVTVENETRLVSENEAAYIPLGARHRLENPGKLPMVLIEVQTGSYLGDDDIVRYEDVYARD